MRLVWTAAADRDIARIEEYIAQDSPAAAVAVGQAIDQRAVLLMSHPMAGRVGRVRGTRELVLADPPFILAYRIDGDRIVILRVLHGARQWPAAL